MIVIEIEFKSEKEAYSFLAPDWFGKEITGVKKYSNSSLAKSSYIKIPTTKHK